ncbi:MAG: ArdC-like ssDNA-binding domain-containing protein [Longimicrobiales bacterium]
MQDRSNPTRRDAYEVITDRIIAALEAGTAPWRRPWNVAAHGALRNAMTGHVYRGVNVPMLSLTASTAGYTDPRWLTFRQAKKAGGAVRKGERGTPVVYWQWIEKKDDDGEKSRFPILRLYTVFNVEQCDGLRLEPLTDQPETPVPIDTAERIIAGYTNGPAVEHGGWRVRTVERSVRCELETSGLGIHHGTLDLELEHENGTRLVVDMKTQRGRAFRFMLERPKRSHVVQLQTYMFARDADAGLLLYVDREGQNATKQFVVERDDATVQRAARVITSIAARKDVPLPLVRERGKKPPWQCNYCPYLSASCNGPVFGLGTGEQGQG